MNARNLEDLTVWSSIIAWFNKRSDIVHVSQERNEIGIFQNPNQTNFKFEGYRLSYRLTGTFNSPNNPKLKE